MPADIGNTMQLKNIPEGAAIYNVESNPGDGGKFARTSGAFARIIAKMKDKVIVQLPSKKERSFLPECRATMGIVAGSGKTEKPFLKAGRRAVVRITSPIASRLMINIRSAIFA